MKNNKKNILQRAWATLSKAINGEPAKPRAGKATVNTNYADYTLTSAAYEEWVAEAYKNNETVHGALNLIINTLCEAPLQVVDLDGEVIPDHPTLQLLNHINDHSTALTFLKTLILDMYLGDVGYIEKVYNRGGKLTELGLLRPDRVRIFADEEKFISHYSYEVAGHSVVLMPNEVIPLRFVDPSNVYGGFSPLKALAKRIDSDNESTNHAVTMLQNSGQPGSIITVPDMMDPDDAAALARSWSNRFEGAGNGTTAVLQGGMEYTAFGMNMRDLDFGNLKSMDEAKILSTLRIPLQVYGSITGSASSTMNNVQQGRKQFWEQAIIPLHKMIEDALNNDADITDNFTVKVKFDRTQVEALQENFAELAKTWGELYLTHQVATLNETRAALNLPALPDGDDIYSPFGGLLTEEPKKVEEPKEEAKKADPVVINVINEVKEQVKEVISEDITPFEPELELETTSIDRDLELKIALGRDALANKWLIKTLKMADKHLRKHIKDVVKAIGTKSQKALKSFETDRLEKQLDELSEQWLIEYEADSLKTLVPLVEASAKQATLGVGVAFDIESETFINASKANAFKSAQSISQTSRDSIQRIITSSFEEGKSLGELSKEIQALGPRWTESRAATIARTETTKAANVGARIGYKESGVVEKLMYSAILDGNTSDICSSLNGKVVGVNESFIKEGSGFTDSQGVQHDLRYTDGGVQEPPAHPNCRSTIIPIIESKSLGGGTLTYKIITNKDMNEKQDGNPSIGN